jgi:hypothetical protein
MRMFCATWFVLSVAFNFSPSPVAAEDGPPAKLSDLSWIAGSWLQTKNGIDSEENWIAPKGEIMLGISRTVRGDGRTSFEYLRIAKTQAGIIYFASPQGRAATEFPLKAMEGKKVTFENEKHDFPQRIIYWLGEDGNLHARIEGTVNGQARGMEWQWKRQTAD